MLFSWLSSLALHLMDYTLPSHPVQSPSTSAAMPQAPGSGGSPLLVVSSTYAALPRRAGMPLVLSAPLRAALVAACISPVSASVVLKGCKASTSVRSPGLAGVCAESSWRAWLGAKLHDASRSPACAGSVVASAVKKMARTGETLLC